MAINAEPRVAPGDVDTSFGDGGKVILSFPGGNFVSVWGMALTPEGKILAVGSTNTNSFIMGRLSRDGVIDTAFGDGGAVTGQFLGYPSVGRSIHALNDGKLLVTGTHIADDQVLPAASRLLSGGEFDSTFGDGGSFVFPPPGKSSDIAITDQAKTSSSASTQSVILPDGKILIGHSLDDYGLLVRLTADGVLDTSFNNTGYATVRYPDDQTLITYMSAFRVTMKGEVILCGQAQLANNRFLGVLARYGADGRPDRSFGSEGSGFIGLEPAGRALRVDDLVVDGSGNSVCVGTLGILGGQQAAITFGRIADGSPDPDFNNGEITEIDLPVWSEWYSAAMSPLANTVLMTGITFDENYVNQGMIVGRYLRTGQLDTDFGRGKGCVFLDPGQEPRLILQGESKVLLCCRMSLPDNTKGAAVMRLLN